MIHKFDGAPGVPGPFGVPVTAFKLAHGGARIDSPPPRFGEHNDQVLRELGYTAAEIERLRTDKVIGAAPDNGP